MFSQRVADLLHAAVQNPVLESLAIIAGTFVLEDAATVLAAAQVHEGTVSPALALGSLYVGIVLGDLGLYGLGYLAALVPWARRLIPPDAMRRSQTWLGKRLIRVVFVSRFLPGARLPTYTACGFLRADFLRFAATAVVATLIWTTLLFSLSVRMGEVLTDTLGAWRWVGFVGFAIFVVLAGRAAASLQETR
jgi:membrane protein DedA with SNARE-associated domain